MTQDMGANIRAAAEQVLEGYYNEYSRINADIQWKKVELASLRRQAREMRKNIKLMQEALSSE